MSSKSNAKERFLRNVKGVSRTAVFDEISKNTDNLDLYTFFVTKDAFCTGKLEDNDINEFLVGIYSDWYFLHKKKYIRDTQILNLLTNENYSPLNLTQNKCLEMIKSDKFRHSLPIHFQYINKLEDKYFICIKTDELYGYNFNKFTYDVRLYLNIPCNKLLDFSKEFLDRAYNNELPALFKILNNDFRCDTITIYTDYEFSSKIVDTINDIKRECPSIFLEEKPVNPLLGSIDDYIGFGEQLRSNATYFSSRSQALTNISKLATLVSIKECFLDSENIVKTINGERLTITDFLEKLIENNAKKLIEEKIEMLKLSKTKNKDDLSKLNNMLENIHENINLKQEVLELKKSLTHNGVYRLKLNGIGEDNYNYINRLYNIFNSMENDTFEYKSNRSKKNIINSKIYREKNEFFDIKTLNFLEMYFQAELSSAISDIIEQENEDIRNSKYSGVIQNIKKKFIAKLKDILSSILDDEDDEGKEYIYTCIYDFFRILSTESFENVQCYIDGKEIIIEKDVNSDILNMLPNLKERVDFLTNSPEFVDKTLRKYGIHKDNLCLNNTTENILKSREQDKDNSYNYSK